MSASSYFSVLIMALAVDKMHEGNASPVTGKGDQGKAVLAVNIAAKGV